MMPGKEQTQNNIEQIDARIKPDYAPRFRSPSGKVLGMPDIDGKKKDIAPSVSNQDSRSVPPKLWKLDIFVVPWSALLPVYFFQLICSLREIRSYVQEASLPLNRWCENQLLRLHNLSLSIPTWNFGDTLNLKEFGISLFLTKVKIEENGYRREKSCQRVDVRSKVSILPVRKLLWREEENYPLRNLKIVQFHFQEEGECESQSSQPPARFRHQEDKISGFINDAHER